MRNMKTRKDETPVRDRLVVQELVTMVVELGDLNGSKT